MPTLPQIAGFLLLACTVALAPGLTSGMPYVEAASGEVASPQERFQKTYKRRCTSSKCKQVSESTKPIFKCPFCGSSTVPVN